MKQIMLNLFGALAVWSALNFQVSTVCAQAAVVTYQGRVTSHGTNFTGTGQFKAAIVTSTNNSHTAAATANLSGGFVISYTVTFGGNGYTVAPAVTVSGGGGSGATAHAVISGGVVTSVVADTAGSGYTNPPVVTIADPPADIIFTTFWSNDGSSVNGSEPAAAVSASVDNGLFTLGLGDTSLANMMALDANLFIQPNLRLRLWFNDGASGFAALNPPQNLTYSPYAAYAAFANDAGSADNVSGPVSAAQLTGTISSNNIGAGTITGTMLAAGSVTTSKLADAAVMSAKVATNTLSLANLAQEVLDRLLPTGTVVAFAGINAPAGWALCDGSIRNGTNATFSALFAVIGQTYGIGDGTASSFNLPDLRGRTVIGAGQGTGLSLRTLAAKPGVEANTQVPGHTHSLSLTTSSSGSHTHTILGRRTASGSLDTLVGSSGTTLATSAYDTFAAGAHTHSVSGNTAATGVSSVDNMQPSVVLNYLIKL